MTRMLAHFQTPYSSQKPVRFIDLFCGIGGFRIAFENAAYSRGLLSECVFSSDIDEHCQRAYAANFGEKPFSDISRVEESKIPDHDVLLAGFPCQPFSIIGQRKGFEDTRGTLFFDIARILETKKPSAFILENVKMLEGHNGGRTIKRIMQTLRDLGYSADRKILNALHFGLPQKRERVFIVGFKRPMDFPWPDRKIPMKPLSQILEKRVPEKFFASSRILKKRREFHKPTAEPTIWHENKSGHIGVYPYSCALRAGASYNYLLVNGERRLTPREMLRLQGFPDGFKIICTDSQTRKQAGNSLPIPVAEKVIGRVLDCLTAASPGYKTQGTSTVSRQLAFLERRPSYPHAPAKTPQRRKIRSAVPA